MKVHLKLSLSMLIVVVLGACKSIIVKSDYATGEILARSGVWNEAFVDKDINKLMELFSPDAQLATAGGKWKDRAEGHRKFSSLITKRPDLRWYIHPKKITVNEAWEVAYERGDWVEWWSEPDGKATIKGTYFFMWKKSTQEPWCIHAAIFTPLSCTGESSYCQPHNISPKIIKNQNGE